MRLPVGKRCPTELSQHSGITGRLYCVPVNGVSKAHSRDIPPAILLHGTEASNPLSINLRHIVLAMDSFGSPT